MKILSQACSLLLLGISLFSGSAFAMEGDAAAELRPSSRAVGKKLLTIDAYNSMNTMVEDLSSGILHCDTLELRIRGDVISRVKGGAREGNPMDPAADLRKFLSDLGKDRTLDHGIYSLPSAVAEIKKRSYDPLGPSPRCIRMVLESRDVDEIEREKGPMACATFALLSLCPNVTELTLECFRINQNCAQALQQKVNFSLLKSLEITYANLTDKEVAALLSKPLPALERLDLSHNEISGIPFSGVSLPVLKELKLCDNKVGNAGLKAVTQSLSPLLQKLSLVGNDLNEDGIRTAHWDWNGRGIEELLLDCTHIGDDGRCFLESSTHLSKLKVLSLKFLKTDKGAISKEGYQALLTHLKGCRIAPGFSGGMLR